MTRIEEKIDRLKGEIEGLESELEERRRSLPAHSVRPHQLIRIEELEEEIKEKKALLEALIAEGKP